MVFHEFRDFVIDLSDLDGWVEGRINYMWVLAGGVGAGKCFWDRNNAQKHAREH